ncbi:MAG: DMSO/selenate family reductase complex A subunit [Brooklawnia sp.]
MTSTQTCPMQRRSFLKWSGAVAGTTALVGSTATMLNTPAVTHAAPAEGMSDVDKTVWNVCFVNCGSRCPMRLQVKDGVIVRCLPENTGDDSLENRQLRACVRGRSIRNRVYSPDRVKTPLIRREGTERGAGQWDEISWDDALDLVAEKIKYTIEKYGNEAIYLQHGSGVLGGAIGEGGPYGRLFNLLGGSLKRYGNYSYAQVATCTKFSYGQYQDPGDPNEVPSNSFEDSVANSQLVVMFGNNPQETRMSGGGILYTSQFLKRKGVRTIVIDPMYSETAMVLADQWIPIKPGTDSALVSAIVHYLISNDLHDQEFCDKYVQGFDEDHMPEGIPANQSYRSYIMGQGPDGIEKTPAWAAPITGIPEQTITALAREIGNAKPCAITQGWGPQRHMNGENQARAIYTLAAVTGNVGINGGGTGGRDGSYWRSTKMFPAGDNPVQATIPLFIWTEAVLRGEELTATKDGIRGVDRLPVSIKFQLQYGGSKFAGQHSDINRTLEIMRDESLCEFVVVVENQMTPSAEYADLVLPDTLGPERWDIGHSEYCGDVAYYMFHEKAIEPGFEIRDSYDIAVELAKRLGVEQEYSMGRTREEWAQWLAAENASSHPGFPNWDELREVGVHRYATPENHVVPMRKFREDPEANPLTTPSGKIEIFSTELWEMAKTWTFEDQAKGDKITALPEYMDTFESAEEAKTNEQYPLQCIGHHFKGRVHSTFANLEWLKDIHPQRLFINPIDAETRGIESGDVVDIYNDRGRVRVPAFVTPRIIPGVVSLPQGAWYKDEDGVDVGGNINTLTTLHRTAYAKGNPQHTNLVQVIRH